MADKVFALSALVVMAFARLCSESYFPGGFSGISLSSPAYFTTYSKMYQVQQEIDKNYKNRGKILPLIEYKNDLKAVQRKLEETATHSQFLIKIAKKDFTLTLYENDLFMKEYDVAIGKRGKTKNGLYKIIKKYEKPWFPKAGRHRNVGSLVLNSREGIVIHGTTDESSIGKAVSSGCIRMKKRDALELVGLIPLNTPVEIE